MRWFNDIMQFLFQQYFHWTKLWSLFTKVVIWCFLYRFLFYFISVFSMLETLIKLTTDIFVILLLFYICFFSRTHWQRPVYLHLTWPQSIPTNPQLYKYKLTSPPTTHKLQLPPPSCILLITAAEWTKMTPSSC